MSNKKTLSFEEARGLLSEKLGKKVGTNKMYEYLKNGLITANMENTKSGYEITEESIDLFATFKKTDEESLFNIFKKHLEEKGFVEKIIYEFDFGELNNVRYEYLKITKKGVFYEIEAKYGPATRMAIKSGTNYCEFSYKTITSYNEEEEKRTQKVRKHLHGLCEKLEKDNKNQQIIYEIEETLEELYSFEKHTQTYIYDQLNEQVDELIVKLNNEFEDELKYEFDSCKSKELLEILEEKEIIDIAALKKDCCDLVKSQKEIYFEDDEVIKDIEISYSIELELASCSLEEVLRAINHNNYTITEDYNGDNNNFGNDKYNTSSSKRIEIELELDEEESDTFSIKLEACVEYYK